MIGHLHRKPIEQATPIVTASQASKKDRPGKLNFPQQQPTTNSPAGQMNKHTCVIAAGHEPIAKLCDCFLIAIPRHSILLPN